VQLLSLDVRAGLHTGEVEVTGDDIAGMAVHIGARVGALAGRGEVLVSSTVKELVAGSDINFDDRGQHQLKGVPGSWRLWAVLDWRVSPIRTPAYPVHLIAGVKTRSWRYGRL
jgi:class 3 adenylate cyclase